MRYIITGASGHIGNNLVRMINQKEPDAEIIILTRRKIGKELEGCSYTQIIGDMNDKSFFEKNIKKGDRVIHSAGLIDLSNKCKEEMYKINVLMTKNICDASRKADVDKFVYIGSVDAIYKAENSVITEPSKYFPEKLESEYGRTKAEASQYVLSQIENNSDFNAGIILPTAVIGINDHKPSEAGKIIQSTLNGKPEFGIKGGYNFTDVRDVCRAIIALCDCDKRGQYIISGENVSVKQLYSYINEYKHLKQKPIILPTFVALMACPFVKMLNKLMIKVLLEPHDYSSKKAELDLAFSPTPFIKTLQDTVDWHESTIKKSSK